MDHIYKKQIALIRRKLADEASERWARLYTIPSTAVWHTLDYLTSLEATRQNEIIEAISNRAPTCLGAENPPHDWNNPVLDRFQDDLVRVPKRHIPARMLRQLNTLMESDDPDAGSIRLTEAQLREAKTFKPAKGPEIQKAVNWVLYERFGSKPKNQGGGVWIARAITSSREFSLSIDYGAPSSQLSYGVDYQDKTTSVQASGLTYERLLGVGQGMWDYLTEDNLERSIQLLADLIDDLLSIPEQLNETGST